MAGKLKTSTGNLKDALDGDQWRDSLEMKQEGDLSIELRAEWGGLESIIAVSGVNDFIGSRLLPRKTFFFRIV